MTDNAAPKLSKPLVIGLLGGTFDPPHRGHLALAQHLCQVCRLDELILIPAGQPWQKTRQITAANHRLAMTELAAEHLRQTLRDDGCNTVVKVDTLEMVRSGPSYAVDTVQALREQFGVQACLVWLMGYDQWLGLPTWHQWERLFECVNLAIATRPGYNAQSQSAKLLTVATERLTTPTLLQSSPYGKIIFDTQLVEEVSSTALRTHLAHSHYSAEVAAQLPATILQYISAHALYRNTTHSH